MCNKASWCIFRLAQSHNVSEIDKKQKAGTLRIHKNIWRNAPPTDDELHRDLEEENKRENSQVLGWKQCARSKPYFILL